MKKILIICLVMTIGTAAARDPDGRFVNSPLKDWFNGLASEKGPCCSDADGMTVEDPDWETKKGHYRVRLNGEWVDVPDEAVINAPNRAGRTIVWPLYNNGKLNQIRCFIVGPLT